MTRLRKFLLKHYRRIERRVAVAVYGPMRPTGMVIGAQKAGTTALYKYLSQHPQVVPSIRKELHFFNIDRNYAKGIGHYLNYFEANTPSRQHKITLDISPGYLHPAEKTAGRIHAFNPDMRLIATLRDPVSRAYSAWQMYRRFYQRDKDWFFKWMDGYSPGNQRKIYVARETFGQSFLDDVRFELEWLQKNRSVEMLMLDHGLYAQQLEYFYQLFPREQLLIICNEEMRRDTPAALAEIETHLRIAHHDWHNSDTSPHFEGNYTDKITSAERDLLSEYYKPYNEKLFLLLNRRFDWC
jgi:hypothetical protein